MIRQTRKFVQLPTIWFHSLANSYDLDQFYLEQLGQNAYFNFYKSHFIYFHFLSLKEHILYVGNWRHCKIDYDHAFLARSIATRRRSLDIDLYRPQQ